MLALAVHRDSLCHRCQGELAETTSPLLDPDNRAGSHYYKAKPPKRCHRCTALMASDKAYSSNEAVSHPHALIHHVEKVPRRRRG